MYRCVSILFAFFFGSTILAQNKNLFLHDQKIISIDLEGNQKELFKNSSIDLSKVKLLKSKKYSYLLDSSSGMVYEITQDSIRRIDRSYEDKVHSQSLDFIHRDTIFRFGGYGYFNSNRNLIFFDEKSKEWDLVKYKGYNLIDGFSNVQTHFIKKNKLFVFGYSTTDNEYQNENFLSRKGFIYNFDTRSIEKTFEIDESFIFPRDYVDVNEDMIFLFPDTHKEELRILDKNSLNLFQYRLSIGDRGFYRSTKGLYKVIDGSIFYLSKNINKEISIKSFLIDPIIKNKKQIQQRIIKETHLELISLLILLCVVMLVTFYKVRNKGVRVSKTYLWFNNSKIKMDPKSIQIIYLLIKKQYVSNNTLNELFYRDGLSSIHINRQKNIYVENINKLFFKLSDKKLIYKQKTIDDKRLVEYFINPNVHKHK